MTTSQGGPFPFGGMPDIFEQFFKADPVFGSLFNRVQVQPIQISFMVRLHELGLACTCLRLATATAQR